MSGVVAFEGELNSIVQEYLEFSQFEKSKVLFERECTEKGKPLGPTDSKPKTNQKILAIQNEMLQKFDSGNRREFQQLWLEHLPKIVRNDDSVAQKLDFYLNIYFAIYPIKYTGETSEEGMNHFKKFLETRGASLSQTTEFLPFYALPFVPNPKAHPSYRELFSDNWEPDLRSRLEKFLTLALQSKPQPRLFDLYKEGGSRDLQALEMKLSETERKAMATLKRHNRVQSDYHNLISITADLVDSLEATVQGQPVSPEYLHVICQRLFSNQLRQSVDFSRPGTAGEVLRQSVVPPQGLQPGQQATVTALDYSKIKSQLSMGRERDTGFLLQALRWKLTKSSPAERDSIQQSYIQNDFLGCADTGEYKTAVLKLLSSDSELLRQYTGRLLNALASLSDGRTYLGLNPDLLRGLMDNLRSDDEDSLTRENVLGCLQKLSLRRALQTLMIEEGVISWLVQVLQDSDSLSDYTLEYSLALLMNLCLRTAGKKKCSGNPSAVLQMLSDLLGHDNQEIIPYVNGTLYSILAIPSIREEAKAMGMEEILKCFIKEGQADMNRQIEFIIKQLNSSEEPDEVESDDEDDEEDEEDQDAMEADLDKAEILLPQSGELSGDRLLNTSYVTTISLNNKKKRPTDQVANQEAVLSRPVTPSHMKGSDSSVVHVQPKSRPPSGRPQSQQTYRRPTTTGSVRPMSAGAMSRPESTDMKRPMTRCGSRPSSGRTGGRTSSSPQEEYPKERRPASKSSRPIQTSYTLNKAEFRLHAVAQMTANDSMAADMYSKATGMQKKLAVASDTQILKPSRKAVEKIGGQNLDMQEYTTVFGTRPKIPRTPDQAAGGRPTSRGSVGDVPPPQPKYSESLPTPRPGSGGRSSSGSGKVTSSGSKTSSRSRAR